MEDQAAGRLFSQRHRVPEQDRLGENAASAPVLATVLHGLQSAGLPPMRWEWISEQVNDCKDPLRTRGEDCLPALPTAGH